MNSSLTSGRLLAHNTAWNVAGLLLPVAVGLLAIPPLVRGLGAERFGLLSLGWAIIGYFSLFDLGIGRALTKLVADKLAARSEADIPQLVWTSLVLMLGFGVIGALAGLAISPWLVGRWLKVPPTLHDDALRSFWILALSVPVVTVSSGLRGVLEAQQRFRTINVIRTPMSVFTFVGPLGVLPFSNDLVPITIVLVAGRIIGGVAYFLACLQSIPGLRARVIFDRATIWPVVRFGGWMTVTNVVGPVMAYMDRFLVGMVLSVGAIAYYTAPFEVVSRIWVVPGALASVLFPAFAMSLAHDPVRASLLLRRGVKYVFLIVFPVVFVLAVFAPEGLGFWLGDAFAVSSSPVLRWLAAGIFVNCLAQIPFALIHAAGRPDQTAMLHVAELPFYLAALWLLTQSLGIEGTALAWMARSTVDAVLVFSLAARLVPDRSAFVTQAAVTITAGLALVVVGTLLDGIGARLVYAAVVLASFAVIAWALLLDASERLLLARPGAGRSSALLEAPSVARGER